MISLNVNLVGAPFTGLSITSMWAFLREIVPVKRSSGEASRIVSVVPTTVGTLHNTPFGSSVRCSSTSVRFGSFP